jgi:anthranilate synthase component 1
VTTGVVAPDEKAFLELARTHRVVPVTRRLLADGETPVGVYRKLAGGPGTFLLESAEHGASSGGTAWSRYSFVGVRSIATLTERDGTAHWLGSPPAGVPTKGDPVNVLRETVRLLTTGGRPATGVPLPPLTGGLVGFLSYDIVRRFERLPELSTDDLKCRSWAWCSPPTSWCSTTSRARPCSSRTRSCRPSRPRPRPAPPTTRPSVGWTR